MRERIDALCSSLVIMHALPPSFLAPRPAEGLLIEAAEVGWRGRSIHILNQDAAARQTRKSLPLRRISRSMMLLHTHTAIEGPLHVLLLH